MRKALRTASPRILSAWAGLFVLLAAGSSDLSAQDFATLTVTVSDPAQALVPGAKVAVIDNRRGTVQQGETIQGGYVTFSNLVPSEYSVEVEKNGFNKYKADKLTLNVRDRQTLRVDLQIAAAAGATVNVVEKVEVVSSDSGTGISLDQQFLQNLPVNGRSADSLILLSPGVSTALGGKSDGGINVNGLRSNTNYYTLDGVSMNRSVSGGGRGEGGGGPFGGGGPPGLEASNAESLSIDSMQEIRVQTSAFAPEFGRSPGAQISISSRGGSNQYHGSAFFYLRRDKFDANDWFANSGGYPRGQEHQNRPGGVFGGPLSKNKTFFFASFEELRLTAPYTVIASVPNLITRQTATAALRPYLNAFPIPNGPVLSSTASQYRSVVSNPLNSDTGSLRLDHVLNPRNSLFARYSYAPATSDQRGSDIVTPNVLSHRTSRYQTATVGITTLLRGGMVNDLRAGYSTSSNTSAGSMDNFGGAVPLLDSQVFPNGVTSGTGSFNLNIIGLAGYSLAQRSQTEQKQLNVIDSLTKVSGKHQLKAGLDFRQISVTNHNKSYRESASFNGLTGNTDSFLTGTALNGQVSTSVPTVYPTYINFSLFAQDTWRLNEFTTLTYGLRWDVNPAPYARTGQAPFALSSSTIAGVTQNDPLYQTRWHDVAPRVGISYLLNNTPGREVIVRGGFGLFYDLGYGASAGAFNGAPFVSQRNLSAVTFPFSKVNLAAPTLPPTRPYGFVTTSDSALQSPLIYQWNITVEKSLAWSQTVSVAYVGNSGQKLVRVDNQPSFTSAYDVLALTTNGASSSYTGLQMQYRKRFSGGFQAQVSYTLAKAQDTASNDAGFGGFASLFGTTQKGPSDYDVRHNLTAAGSYLLPAPQKGILFEPVRHWYFDFVGTFRTGLPFDVQGVSSTTSSSSSSSAGLFAQVRPNLTGQPIWISDSKVPGGRRLNPDAFSIPSGYNQGSLARNSLRGFSLSQIDFGLRRMIPLGERLQLNVAAQGYNILNHPNFANVTPFEGGNLSSSNFGIVTRMVSSSSGGGVGSIYRSGGARTMELSFRLQF